MVCHEDDRINFLSIRGGSGSGDEGDVLLRARCTINLKKICPGLDTLVRVVNPSNATVHL